MEPRDVDIDAVSLEIIRSGLQSIPDLIEADLTRTAFSPLIYEYQDYAVGLVDAEGRSIALARHGLPGFLTNVLGVAVQDGLAIYGLDNFAPGDVIITNHAATMGQHLNNVVMYTPIFGAAGLPVAFMAVNVHWIDIGGSYPGSCHGTDNTELIQEGLQIRTVRLFRRGERVEEIFRIIEQNTRQPYMLLGDIAAQHGGCVRGAALFADLMRRNGEERTFSAIRKIWSLSAQAAKDAVRAVPEGTYQKTAFLDDDGVEPGKRIPVPVKVHVRNGEFVVDYTDVSPQVKGPFNSGFHGGGDASARVAFKYLFTPDEPANEGSFAPVRVILPEGKLLSAVGNAPMGFYQTPLSTVIDAIIAAMAPVLPDRVAAGHHGAVNVYGFSGTHPATGQFYNFFDTCHGGWGGSAHGDGVGPYKSIRHADNKDIPVEVMEARYPLRIEQYRWRKDSGGAGQHRGGLGLHKTFLALADGRYNMAFERFHCPPWGLREGHEGAPAFAEVERRDGRVERVHKVSALPICEGDRIHIYSGGGGGYGDPRLRPSKAVLEDVANGFVSSEAAVRDYGVADGFDKGTHGIDSAGEKAGAVAVKATVAPQG